MARADTDIAPERGGIVVRAARAQNGERVCRTMLTYLATLGLDRTVVVAEQGPTPRFVLRAELGQAWMPGGDTLELCARRGLDPRGNPDDLRREILLAMLAGPVTFEFPSHAELASAVRMRQYIVEAARRTALAFRTSEAERPDDYWAYTRGIGFTVLPGRPLIEALRKATQPEVSGRLYSFSCYRATEYVILLGIAQELESCNPELLRRLQAQWERRAIMSAQFHDVFLREYGSMEAPLPPRYYVPGDRLWFRNPDEHSSDASGFEGSWVFYLGGGLFTNLWKPERPFTMTAKCLELFHWRHAAYHDAQGDLRIDESIVEARVRASLQDPAEVERILALMLRMRDPKGVYAEGGCIDATREYPRWVCPGTTDLVLPET